MVIYSFNLHWILSFLMLLICLTTIQVKADDNYTIEINDDVEVDIHVIGPPSSTSIIWFACNQGEQTAEFETAKKLVSRDYQVYFPDMLSAHFLSPTPTNIAKIHTLEISQIVQHILQHTESDQVYLVGGARAAVPVLKALADNKIRKSVSKLIGAILITPRINQKTPEPGAEPEYIEEAGLSKHPIKILEGERTPNRWGLPHLSQTLARSGSSVQSELIPGVRGFFYLRNEQTTEEIQMTQQLDKLIHQNIQKLRVNKP